MPLRREFVRRPVCQSAVWSRRIVVLPPQRDLLASIEEIAEPVGIQTFVSKAPVEAFDKAILHGSAGLNVVGGDLSFHTPGQEMTRSDFRAIVHAERFGTATAFYHAVENTRDRLDWQTKYRFPAPGIRA